MRSPIKNFLFRLLCSGVMAGSYGCSFLSSQREVGAVVDTSQFGSCNPTPCVKITLATPPVLPEEIAGEVRAKIAEGIDASLYAPLDNPVDEPSRAALLASVKSQFDEYILVKDPDTVVDWQIARTGFFIYADPTIVNVVVNNEGYLGGAHGFSDATYLVFRGATG